MERERIVGIIPGARDEALTGTAVFTLVVTDRRLIAVHVDDALALNEAREIHTELSATDQARIDVVACETVAHRRLAERLRAVDPEILLAGDSRTRVYDRPRVESVEVTREYDLPIWPWEPPDMSRLRIELRVTSDEPGRSTPAVYHTESERPGLDEARALLGRAFGDAVRV
jgi:hypothetical protein